MSFLDKCICCRTLACIPGTIQAPVQKSFRRDKCTVWCIPAGEGCTSNTWKFWKATKELTCTRIRSLVKACHKPPVVPRTLLRKCAHHCERLQPRDACVWDVSSDVPTVFRNKRQRDSNKQLKAAAVLFRLTSVCSVTSVNLGGLNRVMSLALLFLWKHRDVWICRFRHADWLLTCACWKPAITDHKVWSFIPDGLFWSPVAEETWNVSTLLQEGGGNIQTVLSVSSCDSGAVF